MTLFEPFAAYRFDTARAGAGLAELLAPPYDVLSAEDVAALGRKDPHNIVWIDVPQPADDPERYVTAAERYRAWIDSGVLVRDPSPSFTIYRMAFRDAAGTDRVITGVVGGLAVDGAARVLPHERVTPKASTDRLDLTRATRANLSPVWGLSLASGLTAALAEPGELLGAVVVDDVEHRFERVDDPDRLAAISAIIGSDDVLIADGHHRYGISRLFHEEQTDSSLASGHTLAFVNELIADQLSVEAIHRIYPATPPDELRGRLETAFEIEPADVGDDRVVAEMNRRGELCLLDPGGRRFWLRPRPGAFEGVRPLDGAWLESCLEGVEVDYQHGVAEVVARVARGATAVLIRPVAVSEIERTAREGLLMPPKSTFFTPKLRTGAMIRPLD